MNDAVPVLSAADRALLAEAKWLLEQPGFAARLSNYIGQPIERLIGSLPAGANEIIDQATEKALKAALGVALSTLRPGEKPAPSNRWHQLGAAASGVAGGAFGLPALTVELPVSTTIMLRSIADVARSQGENLAVPEAQLACLETFALGGPRRGDDGTESGYFAARAILAKSVSEAAAYLASNAAASGSAPILVKLIAKIAARFSIPVTTKVAAQTVPVIGGVGGGIINTLFIGHYQDMAFGHFVVRKLERSYGAAIVQAEYERLPLEGAENSDR